MQQYFTDAKNDPAAINTSGQGFSTTVPLEIKGWSWGAFFLTWVWGIGNRVWLATTQPSYFLA